MCDLSPRSRILVRSVCEDEEVEEPDANIITTVTAVAVAATFVVAAAATTAGVVTALGCCGGAAVTASTTVAVVATAGAGVAGGGTAATVHLLKKHGLVGSVFANTNVTRVEAQLQVLTSTQPIKGVADTPLVTLPEAINYMLELLHDSQYKYMSRLKADSNASMLTVPNFSSSSILSTSSNFSKSSILSASDDATASASFPPVPPVPEEALSSENKLLILETSHDGETATIAKSESMKKIRRAKTKVSVSCSRIVCHSVASTLSYHN